MIHAAQILRELDRHLACPHTLILYGRAALALGFQPPLAAATLSLDVDAILPTQQSIDLDTDTAFWEALEQTNLALQPSGLYITHLFEESQVILRPDWLDHLVAVPLIGLTSLNLLRPHALDLVLTKMMRGADPQDLQDIAFILKASSLSRSQIQRAIQVARIPEITEIQEAFTQAVPLVLAMA